jgi:hypothetical protein
MARCYEPETTPPPVSTTPATLPCLAALVARSGNAPLLLPAVPMPDVIGPDMTAVAEQIIRLHDG